MGTTNDRYGVVIGTHSRPNELARALEHIALQTITPVAVVVVDASPSDLAVQNEIVCRDAPSAIRVTYQTSQTASSTVQRNEGVRFMRNLGVNFIQILDDDTAPEADYCERLLRILSESELNIGASGVTKPAPPNPTPMEKFSRMVFMLVGLESYKGGSISIAGCGIPVARRSKNVQQVSWLFGCSMWRLEVFDTLQYNPVLVGAALAEDLHFSLLASRLGHLHVDPKAHLGHSYSPLGRPDAAKFAYRFARNRWYVVRDMEYPWASVPMYVMSNLFLSAITFISAVRRLDRSSLATAGNYLFGMLDAWRDKPPK